MIRSGSQGLCAVPLTPILSGGVVKSLRSEARLPTLYGASARSRLRDLAVRVQHQIASVNVCLTAQRAEEPSVGQLISLVFENRHDVCHVFCSDRPARDALAVAFGLAGFRRIIYDGDAAAGGSPCVTVIAEGCEWRDRHGSLAIHVGQPPSVPRFLSDLCRRMTIGDSARSIVLTTGAWIAPPWAVRGTPCGTCRHVQILMDTEHVEIVPTPAEINCHRCDVCLNEPRACYGDDTT